MLFLRRNYQQSYLTEIGESGTNGYFVRAVRGDAAGIAAKARFPLRVSFPAFSYSGRFPRFDYWDPNPSASDRVDVVEYSSDTISGSAETKSYMRTDFRWASYSEPSTRTPSSTDCGEPKKLYVDFSGYLSNPYIYLAYSSSGRSAFRIEVQGDLYKPFWGTLSGSMPTFRNTASTAAEGCWMVPVEFRLTSNESSSYYRFSVYGYAWAYSAPQHRIRDGLRFTVDSSNIFSTSGSEKFPNCSAAALRMLPSIIGNYTFTVEQHDATFDNGFWT